MVFVLMNDRGYGVIRNIQDAQYGGRRIYADILTPDFAQVCQSVGFPHETGDGSRMSMRRSIARSGGPDRA